MAGSLAVSDKLLRRLHPRERLGARRISGAGSSASTTPITDSIPNRAAGGGWPGNDRANDRAQRRPFRFDLRGRDTPRNRIGARVAAIARGPCTRIVPALRLQPYRKHDRDLPRVRNFRDLTLNKHEN